MHSITHTRGHTHSYTVTHAFEHCSTISYTLIHLLSFTVTFTYTLTESLACTITYTYTLSRFSFAQQKIDLYFLMSHAGEKFNLISDKMSIRYAHHRYRTESPPVVFTCMFLLFCWDYWLGEEGSTVG